MRIHIGSDHAGLELKSQLIEHLVSKGHDVTDHGPYEYDAVDDYPDFCIPAAEAVAKDPASLGIVLGGSGNGEQIAANKVNGIRAALVSSSSCPGKQLRVVAAKTQAQNACEDSDCTYYVGMDKYLGRGGLLVLRLLALLIQKKKHKS